MKQRGNRPRVSRSALIDPAVFSRVVVGRALRRYQLDAAEAVVRSILQGEGRSIAVMISRQGGKNELSAQIEAYLLMLNEEIGGQIVKAAPTFKPQAINSILRLKAALDNPLTRGRAATAHGYQVVLGRARCSFFSAEPTAQVVGATASLALEFDEAQDIGLAKHDREFSPMAASTNATRVYYGTAWSSDTLLARVIEANRAAEERDGERRNFIVPWWRVAEAVPAYGRFVEAEKARLGEGHPLFKTQYRLETIDGEAGLFDTQQRALLRGGQPSQVAPRPDDTHVAGVDLAGPDEEAADARLRQSKPRKDSTVITIGRLIAAPVADATTEPKLEIVCHYWWTGRGHREQYEQMLGVLRDHWRCRRVVVDASGLGAGIADFLLAALGQSIVEPFVFTAASKSRLGFALLAAVNANRLKMYVPHPQPDRVGDLRADPTASDNAAEFWRQIERARYDVRSNQQISFSVPESDGHDDFLLSLALLVRAGSGHRAPAAATQIPAVDLYGGEGRY